MAQTPSPTFEQIDKHVQALDLDAFKPGGKHHVSSAAAPGLPGNLCAAYKAVRGILQLLAATPLIPPKWRAAIQMFMNVMDAICP